MVKYDGKFSLLFCIVLSIILYNEANITLLLSINVLYQPMRVNGNTCCIMLYHVVSVLPVFYGVPLILYL